LATALVIMAGLVPSATVCEMMGEDGRALSKEEAKAYAKKQGLVFLEGAQVVDAWKESRKR
jgi:3,4-dihydroxy 2-butanone 4-phosphate synthase